MSPTAARCPEFGGRPSVPTLKTFFKYELPDKIDFFNLSFRVCLLVTL